MTQNLMDSQYHQYIDYKNTCEYIRQQCHDLKHQIRALKESCTEEEKKSYINELENALESTVKIEDPERRQILLEASDKNNFFYIRMDNCCDDKVIFKNGLPNTTKAERQKHGYGMKGIKEVAERYNGNLSCSLENGWFVTSILFVM